MKILVQLTNSLSLRFGEYYEYETTWWCCPNTGKTKTKLKHSASSLSAPTRKKNLVVPTKSVLYTYLLTLPARATYTKPKLQHTALLFSVLSFYVAYDVFVFSNSQRPNL